MGFVTVYVSSEHRCCVDLHGLGALTRAVKALLFSHQPLKGNPFEKKQDSIISLSGF